MELHQQQQQEENNNNNDNNEKKKKKKTRDLPNLSECHSCGFRIDSCNNGGISRLHTLYSEWRIVLLCKICYVRVETSQLCSYCFKVLSSDHNDNNNNNNNCFHCRQCKRVMHKSCLSNYSNVAPGSFSSKFSVCVDCWVPKSIASKRACVSSKKKKKKKESNYNDNNLLQDVVRVVNCDVQRKAEAAARARELAVEKALAARKAAELAHDALDLVAGHTNDDVQLAMRLHQALNSSPRTLNNLCSVSSAAGLNPLERDVVCRKLQLSHGKSVTDPCVSLRVSGYDSSLNMDSLGSNGFDDGWIRRNAKDSEVRVKEGEGSCSNKLMNSESQSCREGDMSIVLADERFNGKPDRYLIKYTRRTSAGERSNKKPDLFFKKYSRRTAVRERCDGKPDRYLRKYTRRRTPIAARYNGEPDRYSIKYSRRRLNQRLILDNSYNCIFERLRYET